MRLKGVKFNGLQYGPSSLTYFAHRLTSFTKRDTYQQNPTKDLLHPLSQETSLIHQLHRQQQDVLLDLYWQGYHAIYPVIEESQFRKHYQSLWNDSFARRDCPLTDMMLALCINSSSVYSAEAIGVVGMLDQVFYQRAQRHLASQQISPTTAQCYFLNAIYLLAIDQPEAAYMMSGTAIRAAQAIGLQHDDDDETLSPGPNKRLWECLEMLDIHLSLHLGRPCTIQALGPDKSLPYDDDLARLAGPTYTLPSTFNINWLRFHQERQRLYRLARDIHSSFTTVCENLFDEIDSSEFYEHPSTREKCAQYLSSQLTRLQSWTQELPDGLKTARLQGVPFSTDRSRLDLSGNDPLWLQRQRLSLELDYHTFHIVLTRPFISFLPTPALGTLSSDNHCIACANVGVMVTNMLHQVLHETDILAGWYQVSEWQRNAMFAAAGFASGYPICPLSPSSHKAVTKCCAVFEKLGSTHLANQAHQLREGCLQIMHEFCANLGISTPARPLTIVEEATESSDLEYSVMSIGEEAMVNLPADNTWLEVIGSENILWGDLMKDLRTGLSSSFDHVGLEE